MSVVLLWCAVLVSVVYLLPAGLLLLPPVQEKVREKVRSELSKWLGTTVEVGTLRLEWLDRLRVEKITLNDRKGERLLEADYLSVGFQVLPLIGGRVAVDALRLVDFTLHLDREETTGELNAQFVLDAFKSDDTEEGVDLCLQSVRLRKGKITFASEGLNVTGLSAKFSAPVLRKDSIYIRLDQCSFLETRGFQLENLKGRLSGNGNDLVAEGIEIRFPHSALKVSKAKLERSGMVVSVEESDFCPADLAAFVPAFNTFTDTVHLSGFIGGQTDSLYVQKLKAGIGEDIGFDGELMVTHLLSDSMYVEGTVNRLFATSDGISRLIAGFGNTLRLLVDLQKLDTLSFTGTVSGTTEKLKAFGFFDSGLGTLETDVFLGKGTGAVAFTVDGLVGLMSPGIKAGGKGKVTFLRDGNFTGTLSATINRWLFKGYDYTNILLDGDFQQNGFTGSLRMDDPNGAARLNGMFRREGKNSVFDFTADIRHFRSDRLRLTSDCSDPDLSFTLSTKLTGDCMDNVQGILHISNLSLLTATNNFFLSQLTLTSDEQPSGRKLTVSSDLINGELNGNYSFATLIPQLCQTLAGYLPAFFPQKTFKISPLPDDKGEFTFLFTLSNTESLSTALKLPIAVVEEVKVSGVYNNRYDKFRLEAWLPKLRIGRSLVEAGYLSCENPYARIELLAHATQIGRNVRNFFSLKAEAAEDNFYVSFNGSNNKSPFSGVSLAADVLFAKENGLSAGINIHESLLYISDTLWRIMPTTITFNRHKIHIDHFSAEHDDRHLLLNGTLSRELSDTLFVDLHKLELSYIFDILNIPNLRFGGVATGTFLINDPYENRIVQTGSFTVEDFSLNDALLGRLDLHSKWDDAQQGIHMLGSIYNNDSLRTDVNGYIYPVKPHRGLSLHFNANELNIGFLHPLFPPALHDFAGKASGPVHFFGPFSSLSVIGDAYVKDVRIGFDYLNTTYSFSNSIHLDTGCIRISDALLYDRAGNTARVDFSFLHTFFRDYSFSADLHTDNFLAYDQPERLNPMIYGSAFGGGSVHIAGNDKRIDFDISMKSRPNTAVNFNFTHIAAAEENRFIRFVPSLSVRNKTHHPLPDTKGTLPPPLYKDDDPVEVYLNLLLDLTPDATLDLVMNPASGDRLRGRANGNILLQYGTKSDVRMYGTAGIIEGDYNFSLQQFIRRNFKIREGSIITFQGDPMQAILDVDAIYSLSANIGDLDPGLLIESDRTNIPVNCILSLEGVLQHPAISFDIELPGSNGEIERQVRSFINSEGMMSRQIIYLMALNKFYTPSYSSSSGRSDDLSAVASATLSSQLSGLLNSLSDKVQIGTNIYSSYDGMDDTEVEMLLSSQLLDNRLLFNGNFGYRNSYNLGKNVFVGEFDLEYKLIPSGEIRLKAYNHANDMYRYLTQSRTTQGFGILFKKDFTLLPDLFRKRKRLVNEQPFQ
ncbi:MAG: translocation/assembly module TamB [Tannerellaceae bacterium]|jgi:hypothetical protein|nr:translocation/assembly module TamB [Tannerellaceae bacterium]